MQRKPTGVVPVAEALSDLPDLVSEIFEASPRARHPFT